MPASDNLLVRPPVQFTFHRNGTAKFDEAFAFRLTEIPDTKMVFLDCFLRVLGTGSTMNGKPGETGVIVKIDGKQVCVAKTFVDEFPGRDAFDFSGLLSSFKVKANIPKHSLTVEPIRNAKFDRTDSIHVALSLLSAFETK